MATTNVSLRLDSDLTQRAESLYEELGLSLTTACDLFLRQSLRVGGLPFEVRADRPSASTRKAMEEAEALRNDPNAKRYTNLEELFEDLDR